MALARRRAEVNAQMDHVDRVGDLLAALKLTLPAPPLMNGRRVILLPHVVASLKRLYVGLLSPNASPSRGGDTGQSSSATVQHRVVIALAV